MPFGRSAAGGSGVRSLSMAVASRDSLRLLRWAGLAAWLGVGLPIWLQLDAVQSPRAFAGWLVAWLLFAAAYWITAAAQPLPRRAELALLGVQAVCVAVQSLLLGAPRWRLPCTPPISSPWHPRRMPGYRTRREHALAELTVFENLLRKPRRVLGAGAGIGVAMAGRCGHGRCRPARRRRFQRAMLGPPDGDRQHLSSRLPRTDDHLHRLQPATPEASEAPCWSPGPDVHLCL
jgi:hypothetical protein